MNRRINYISIDEVKTKFSLSMRATYNVYCVLCKSLNFKPVEFDSYLDQVRISFIKLTKEVKK